MQSNEDIIKAIHNAIHNDLTGVDIDGVFYEVKVNKSNDCKYIEFANRRFMEQNKRKGTLPAKMARNGSKITWGIPNSTNPSNVWIYCLDGQVLTDLTKVTL